MTESLSPLRERTYKLRTHSNVNIMFSRPSLLRNTDRQSIQEGSINVLTQQIDKTIQNNPLLNALSKPHRKLQDGMVIYNLIQELGYFQVFFNQGKLKGDAEQIYHLCTKLQLEVFYKGSVILKEGDISNDKMYLLLIGNVHVFKNNSKFNKLNFDSFKPHLNEESHFKEFLKPYQKKFGEVINILNPGNYFGEKALIDQTKQQPYRSASCIATTDVYLMTLDRWELMEVLGEFKQDAAAKLDIFKKIIPNFDSITSSLTVESLLYSFKEEIKSRDDIITNENDEATNLYILVEGEVAILKSYQNHQMLLCSLHNLQLIGEESLFTEKYHYTIIVKSASIKLLKISSELYHSKVSQECLKGIKSMMEKKLITRTQLLKTIVKNNQEQKEKQKQFLKARISSQIETNIKEKYYGLSHRCTKKFEQTAGSAIFSNNYSLGGLINQQVPVQKSLDTLPFFEMEETNNKKRFKKKLTQTNQLYLLQQKFGIQTARNLNNSPLKIKEQDLDLIKNLCKDVSSRTESLYTLNNNIKNQQNSNLLKDSMFNNQQFSSIQYIKQKILNQKKHFLMKSVKQFQDSSIMKVRCSTLEK